MQLFRLDDREVRRQQVSSQLGVDVEQLKTLPRALRQAAASGESAARASLCNSWFWFPRFWFWF